MNGSCVKPILSDALKTLLTIMIFLISYKAIANDNVVNIYTWSNYIPENIVKQFTKETGIRVNVSYFDSNATLYAKIRSNPNIGYDIITPTSYYLQRMQRLGLLHKLDKIKLSNFKNLNPTLLNKSFDPHNQYSFPYIWGITGIVYNDKYYTPGSITSWKDLWNKKYRDKILLLNDQRDVFSLTMIKLGYSVNTTDPEKIKSAYEALLDLLPNVKLFNSDAYQNIYADDDATLGIGWNGDINRLMPDNKHIRFVYPKEGFVLWIDTLAIPKNAPHLKNAYRFMNFILRPDIAKMLSLETGFASPNQAAVKLLPKEIRNNPTIYPSNKILERSHFQTGLPAKARTLYENYWEKLKLST